jgi:hypothetical protein
MDFTFNPRKSAQASAVLLKLNGGSMDKYKFIKMLYWSDRVSLEKWSEPITGDKVASMPYGQVLSDVFDLTKGSCPWARSEWEPFIADADEENRITLRDDPGTDELSKAEIKILEDSYAKFKDMRFKEIKAFFRALPEHEDVGRTSKALPFATILQKLGKTPEEISAVMDMCAAEKLLGA